MADNGVSGFLQQLAFHPLAEKFRLLKGEEFEKLAEDIRTNGLREPIVLYEGKILDGRSRYRACQEGKVDIKMRKFDRILIKPSHYDDDGYIIQWMRSSMPSNSLAAVYGLAQDCAQRRVLGEATPITVAAYDETNIRVRPDRLARDILAAGGGMVGLVGVQSNQYPRAMDLARRFRALGINVAIGGFHVSGSLAMLPTMMPELQEAIDLGIVLYAATGKRG